MYCFNDGPVVKGEGKPVDRIDTTCRQLMRCERCVQIDRENEDLPVDCDNHRGYHYRAKKSDIWWFYKNCYECDMK